ncbi:MAG: hypothetical protein LBE24_04860 [Methylobacillus sp.]|nr:hypothetical protein [Methylobacillus sp.]
MALFLLPKKWIDLLVLVALVITGIAFLVNRSNTSQKQTSQKRMPNTIWNGHELVAGIAWPNCLLRMVLCTFAICIFVSFNILLSWADGFDCFMLVIGNVIGLPVFGFLLLISVWLIWQALQTGYVLRINAEDGLYYCLGPKVAWSDIKGIDVREVVTPRFGSYNRFMFALSASAAESLRHSYPRFGILIWRGVDVNKAQLVIDDTFINVPPALLYGAASHFAMQANSAFNHRWRDDRFMNPGYVEKLQKEFEQMNESGKA